MKYLLFIFLFASTIWAQQMPALNIQTSMTSAKEASFGRLTPYETNAIGNFMVNPASLGGISFNQFAISNLQLSAQFDYRHLAVVIPNGDHIFSVAYGTNVTAGFTETDFVNGVVYDIGTFSSGFDVLHLGYGRRLNEGLLFTDHFNYGFGFSVLSQVIGSKRRSPAYGLDVGFIGTSFFDGAILNRFDYGASIIGALSTNLPQWEYDSNLGVSSEQKIERQIFAGAKFSLLDYSTMIHTGMYAQTIRVRDFMIGAEYRLSDSIALRGSTTYDFLQEQKFVYHFGMGVFLKRVAGFGNNIYNMSLDYNYTMYPFPRSNDPSHTLSLTFLGESTDSRPIVLVPKKSFQTKSKFVDFSGTADRNAMIYIYNGTSLIGQVKANNNGAWEVKNLLVNSGYNSIVFRSKSGNKDLSNPSVPIVVSYDDVPPKIDPKVNVLKNKVSIEITATEPLKKALLVSGNQTIAEFRSIGSNQYSTVVDLPESLQSGQPLPDKMVSYDITAIDSIGNQAPTASVSFFVEPIFPADQAVIYNDAITVLGYASPQVDQITVNGKPLETDKKNAFSSTVELGYGKQLVLIEAKTENGQSIKYHARLLAMKRFSDIPKFAKYRRDIEFLATLGFVDGKDDGLFHPDEEMTRRDVTLAIARQLDIKPKELDYDPFLDVTKSDPDAGLISAAVDAGVTFAYADGTFKPNDKVSLADAFKMLNNSGVIDSEDVVVSKKPIKRYEFALYFKQVRRYDQRVNYLMDWDQGYTIPE